MTPLRIPALAAVFAAALILPGCGSSSRATANGVWDAAPSGATVVSLVVSPEKQSLMRALVRGYNASHAEVGGKRTFIEGQTVASGVAETEIVAGQLKPTVWSPAGSLWGRLLDFSVDRAYFARQNPSIVRTPLVIAMWQPEARALGWPTKRLGFSDLSRLARSPGGWAAFGHPEFGPFALVHTNPDYSTAGLEAVVAEYYAATGKSDGLTAADLARAHGSVKSLESSIVHYGDTTLFVADHLVADGPGYASAAILEESVLLDVNRRLAKAGSANRLVAIYPKEGTFYSDSPFAIMNAPWVTPAQAQAARAFGVWLSAHLTPQLAAQYGFRPANPGSAPVVPGASADGVDASQPTRLLGLPAPRVLAQVRASWHADRKPARVLLLLDTTGSMADDGKLEGAKQGLHAFLGQASAQDSVGLTTFALSSTIQVPVGPLSSNRAQLLAAVDGLQADGNTALYDAVVNSFQTLRAQRDRSHINAVVVLTDGQDNSSSRSLATAVAAVKAQGDSANQVRVFTIAYGKDASTGILKQIADASGGGSYRGDPTNITQVYQSISSFF